MVFRQDDKVPSWAMWPVGHPSDVQNLVERSLDCPSTCLAGAPPQKPNAPPALRRAPLPPEASLRTQRCSPPEEPSQGSISTLSSNKLLSSGEQQKLKMLAKKKQKTNLKHINHCYPVTGSHNLLFPGVFSLQRSINTHYFQTVAEAAFR